MEANYFVGVDISKHRLDWQVNDSQNQQLFTGAVGNTPAGIRSQLQQWRQKNLPLDKMVICFEHTGPYGLLLAAILEMTDICYVMVSATEVQRSLGTRRGKSDRLDARRLAEYVWRFRDKLTPGQLPSQALLELRSWLLWREKLIKMRTAMTNAIKANRLISQVADVTEVIRQMENHQDQLSAQLRQVDRKIEQTIRSYDELNRLYMLLRSIPGIGPVIAGWLLIYTEGFTRFATARQFACFVGSAPFPNQSGEHKGSDRVSRWRCQRMKTLLLNGIHSAIQYDPEMETYFRRKCGEGKHLRSVKNAVVCKLIYRIFAVINRGTPYVKLYHHQVTKNS